MNEDDLVRLYLEAKADGDAEAMEAAKRLMRRLREGKPVTPPEEGGMEIRTGEPSGLGPARQLAQGLSFGFADESEAALDPQMTVDDVREANRSYVQANPMTAAGLQAAGGVTTGMGVGGLATKLPVVAGMNPWVQGAGIGAAEGALAGFGGSTRGTAADTVSDTASGAAIGSLFGLAGNAAAEYLPWLNRGSQSRVASEQMRRGMTPEQAAAEMEALNEGFAEPWAMFGDVNPAATQAAYAASPPNADTLKQALQARQRRQGPLLEQATRDITGVDEGRVAANAELVARRRAEGRQMYDPLRSEAVTPTPAMEETLRTPSGEKAAKRALRAMQDMTGNPDLALDEVRESFDFWHNYQQVLRDMGANKLASKVPLSTPEAGAVLARQKQVMDGLFGQDDWGERYAQATARYRDNSRLIEALTDSEKFMSLKRDEVRAAVSRLDGEEERKAFAAGVVNDLIEKALRSPDGADMARKMVRTPALRENISVVLGEDTLVRLDNQMQKLSRMTETERAVLHGSPTSPREVMQEVVAGSGSSGQAMTDALNLQFGSALQKAFGGGGQQVIPQNVAERIINAAVLQDPATVMQALQELEALRAGPAAFTRFGLGAGLGSAAASPEPGGF